MKVKIFTDGGSRGNPGPAAAGLVILSADDDTPLREEGHFLGEATNNVAEYRAVIAALARAGEMGASEVDLFSDSELLVRQMNGVYKVRNEGLRPLFDEATRLTRAFSRCELHHVRREKNKEADAMVNRALDMKRDVGDIEEPY